MLYFTFFIIYLWDMYLICIFELHRNSPSYHTYHLFITLADLLGFAHAKLIKFHCKINAHEKKM